MVRIEAITEPITIKIDRSPKVHQQADAVDVAWDKLCAQNPRYFNGKMLAFDSYDASTGVIRASVEQYKNHAVRDTVDVGISLLAVTAMLYAEGENDMEYLLGKRSPELHRYGGLWELGPSGGVDVPRFRKTLNPKRIVAELCREVSEEIGIKISNPPYHPIALVHDDAVGSTDIAIQVLVDGMPNLKLNWEYTQTRWMSLDELYQSTQNNPEEFIPTTTALATEMWRRWTNLGFTEDEIEQLRCTD
ncbi:MAG: NUDIX hydrolase [Phycisphaerales bacterium]|nr:NUDIX hydrolase [Phycisphaerales bacterium]